MQRFAWLAMTAALACAGCGTSEQERAAKEAAEQAAKTAEQAAKAAESGAQQAAKGLEQMAKGLEAMASGGAAAMSGEKVDPVSFRDLQALFPELDGWEKATPRGERMTMPFAMSQAEVRYTKGTSRVEIKIVDAAFSQMFLAPYAMMLQSGYEKEDERGYEKSTTVAGQPGWEKWNTRGKDGEVNAVIGKRFLLTIEGDDLDDIKTLHEIAGKIDVAKLAALK
jgi:hypothetical protein